MKTLLAIIILLILAGVGAWYYFGQQQPAGGITGAPVATAMYQCDQGKTIQAEYYQGESQPSAAPNQPPQPGGSVKVTLSDGRVMTLKQTVSADGTRYSDGDPNTQGSETFVFWSKGNGALVLENNQEKSFIGCIKVASDPGGLPQVYERAQNAISMRYPANYAVDESYKYQELGPGKDIPGVKFTIDPSIATGTNLSSDSYVSVEEMPQTQNCAAGLFLDNGYKVASSTTTDNGTQYSVASSTGAGAGNRYEEWVWALPGTNPCIAVRYFIHYGVFENYPAGTVRQFDEPSLLSQFDAMRRTLIVNQ